jgi:hypothetical protein
VPTPAAVEAPQIANPPGVATSRPAISGALLGQDDRTLTVIFTPATRGCGQSYELKVDASRSAVAVAVVGHGGRTVTCVAPRRLVTVLSNPLGGRVLVDGSTGAPITVTLAGHQDAIDGGPGARLVNLSPPGPARPALRA